MHSTYLFMALLLLGGGALWGQTQIITDDDLQGGTTYQWTADQEYLLDGLVILEAGGVLNIEAGTVIRGREIPSTDDAASTLLIAPGAQLNALGSREAPIIFTAERDDLEREDDLDWWDRGLWGGLDICGHAPVASPGDTRALEYAPSITYGGTDPDDYSGTLNYVSIRHGGAPLVPGEVTNTFSLNGVGATTVVDHVDVYASLDDGIALRGGTVNLRYISTTFCGDDLLDWDFGYRGKIQFALLLQSDESDRAIEGDGAVPDLSSNYSRPVISNLTYLGPGGDAPNIGTEAMLLRDRTGASFFNSIFLSFPGYALGVEDRADIADTYDHLATGELKFMCNFWDNFSGGVSWTELINPEFLLDPTNSTAAALVAHLESGENFLEDPLLINSSTAEASLLELDPRPLANSPTIGASCPVGDPFFITTSYVGAFSPEEVWLSSWSGMAANAFFSFLVANEEVLRPQNPIQIAPNPARDLVWFHLPATASGPIPYEVWSTNGQLMQRGMLEEGTNKINVQHLAEGTYLTRFPSLQGVVPQRLVVIR
jgi:hypothetical protein